MKADKSILRARIKKMRNDLDNDFVSNASKKVCEKFIELYGDRESFLFYCNFGNEIETESLFNYLHKRGKKIYLPRMCSEEIFIGRYEGREFLKTCNLGIKEPASLTDEPEQIDVAIVPALVFDKKCNRIGFGKGYYDKLLKNYLFDLKVGFAYDFQIVERIETEEHDVPLDVVITEKNIYRRK